MTRIIVSLAMAAVLGAGCSAPGGSIEQYAPAVEGLASGYTAEVESLRAAYATGLEGTITDLRGDLEGSALRDAVFDETVGRSTVLFSSLGDALDRYIRDLGELGPPAEISADHDDFVSALVVSRSGISPILETLTTATSFEQIDGIIAGSGFADAQLRVRASCGALEQAIGTNGMEVDLRCDAMG